MKWLDRLMGNPPKTPSEEDERAIKDLRQSFRRVQSRTERLERELLRVNTEYRRQQRIDR